MTEFVLQHPLPIWLAFSLLAAVVAGIIDLAMLDSRLQDHVPRWVIVVAIILGPVSLALGIVWVACKLVFRLALAPFRN